MAESAGASSAPMPMVCQLILADHRRINRLFAALDDGQRLAAPWRAMLSSRLAQLVNVHMAAEEEICYPVLFGTGGCTTALLDAAIADHGDINEALAEAELASAGSAVWSRAVADASSACARHFASEEQALLPEICANLNAEADKFLTRQWQAFTASQAGTSALTGAEAWRLVAGSRLT